MQPAQEPQGFGALQLLGVHPEELVEVDEVSDVITLDACPCFDTKLLSTVNTTETICPVSANATMAR